MTSFSTIQRILLLSIVFLTTSLPTIFAEEVVLNFETGPLGEWIPAWEEKGVSFKLAWEPTQSKAKGSLTFFPHIATNRRGILCAMADEPIPVEARFPHNVSTVTITFWAQTGSSAKLEAFNLEGQLIDTTEIAKVPQRKAPGEPMPQFDMTVAAKDIAYIRFSGPRSGEFLAADKLRFQ